MHAFYGNLPPPATIERGVIVVGALEAQKSLPVTEVEEDSEPESNVSIHSDTNERLRKLMIPFGTGDEVRASSDNGDSDLQLNVILLTNMKK